MTPPDTTKTQPPTEAPPSTTAPARPSSTGVDHDQFATPDRGPQRVIWVGIALALTAALGVLLAGLTDDGVDVGDASPADVSTGDREAGMELFVEDLRSIGRIDPVAGREAYFEDLRSIGRDPNVWRDAYFDDLRSIGRIDPVAGREAYFEDLRSIGR